MLLDILQDAFFAAIAAIGFAAISRPPRRAFVWCALIAAAAHSLRYLLINADAIHLHIVSATFIAAFFAGSLAVFTSPMAKTPAETALFPSLLPMIPGIYAYKAFGGVARCLTATDSEAYGRAFYLFSSNAITCLCILLGMVVGATIPIFMFKKISFEATR